MYRTRRCLDLTLINSRLCWVFMATEPPIRPNPSSAEVWLRKVNQTWLVRSDLAKNASDYLDHLQSSDPERLDKTCRLVVGVMRLAPRDADPKPRFYGALFCFATDEEQERFLAGHRFTRLALPSCTLQSIASADFAQPSLETLNEVRQAIAASLRAVEEDKTFENHQESI